MEKEILNAITEPLSKENIKVVDVIIGEEDNVKTLFITIDSDEVVDINLSVKATKIINPIIDELNLDLGEYVLDIGSKGVK